MIHSEQKIYNSTDPEFGRSVTELNKFIIYNKQVPKRGLHRV